MSFERFNNQKGASMRTSRRQLLAAAGASALAIAPQANAQTAPAIRWRMVTSYPKSLDVLHGGCELIARRVGELTNGQFIISVHAAGEVVPALAVFDAVSNNTVQCGHTAAYYYIGKDTSFIFDTALPFGMNARNHVAWLRHGGGLDLLRDLYKKSNIFNIPAGNTGAQAGGWFRKEIKSVKDLKGLRMRIPGWGARIMAELGVIPQNIPGGEVYAALEKGTIDATEWVGPHDDEKLGLSKVASNYYFPGWWEPCGQLSMYINTSEWEKLPKQYQSAIETACGEAYSQMLSEYDAKNPTALRRLVSQGTKLRRFPNDLLQAANKKSNELFEEESNKNSAFKALLTSYREFEKLQSPWYGLSEYGMESFMRRSNPS
jgi:TRAP-type mannitol/chloroaromatic compound transport system substrate-binding protein